MNVQCSLIWEYILYKFGLGHGGSNQKYLLCQRCSWSQYSNQCCIAVIHIQLYTYSCGNKINNNDERTHFFRKIYLSHIILERVAKGLCVRGELETEQTATYWPQIPLSLAVLLSHSVGLLNRGSLRAQPSLGAGSHYSILSPTNSTCLCHRVI